MFISKFFYIAIGALVSIIAGLLPKRENLWVFGCCRGTKYAENAKYLFEYVNERHKNIQCVWISKDKNIIEMLRKRGYRACGFLSLQGLWGAARAGVAIITHRGNCWDGDLPFFCISKKTLLVQLWHGIPLKKIAFDDRLFSYAFDESSWSFKLRTFAAKLLPFLLRVEHPSIVIATSSETRDILSQAFRVPRESVLITGYPRNDQLFRNNQRDDNFQKILYLPTFRGQEGASFDPFENQAYGVDDLNTFLVEKGMHLHIKLHPFNRISSMLQKSIDTASNLTVLLTDDIYEELAIYDVLITDYSSIYFDFLLTGKPIIFLPYDMDRYTQMDRQFYYRYENVTPGPMARNWHDVSLILADLNLISERYRKQYKQVLDRFHQFKDGNSCQRVFMAIDGRERMLS
ncbi:MAG: CDP-glycerol glycerophosphotransferase family protein [Desulfobulbus sp.]|nr:CDP-glycerol glycerophosphotransferase family protein [Desulfobulbus sp.]